MQRELSYTYVYVEYITIIEDIERPIAIDGKHLKLPRRDTSRSGKLKSRILSAKRKMREKEKKRRGEKLK